MDLENALEKALSLRNALATEVENARGERQLLGNLDANGLFARAAQRGEFLADVARIERELVDFLARATDTAGVSEISLTKLRALFPREGEVLVRTLSEIRSLAGALNEVNRLNQQLAGRALACVRGYLDALHPTPRAYDRRGTRAFSAPALAMVSSKG
ncbi:MAG TPA: flagellar export chaperone FlgN [Anaeromyxobacteraceae bacterium]|nr:flagellar export chaperone FlgN [Anaeromyxobacteraceae bacterium]